MKLRTDALADAVASLGMQDAMKPEDDAESMETLGWVIVLGVVVAPLVLLFA